VSEEIGHCTSVGFPKKLRVERKSEELRICDDVLCRRVLRSISSRLIIGQLGPGGAENKPWSFQPTSLSRLGIWSPEEFSLGVQLVAISLKKFGMKT
jgi:hypothetical protein